MSDIHNRMDYEEALKTHVGSEALVVARRLIDVVEQGGNSKMVYGGARVSAIVSSLGWPYRPIHTVWFDVPHRNRKRFIVTRDVAFGYEWWDNNQYGRYERPELGTEARSRLDQWDAEIESLGGCERRELDQTVECSFYWKDAAEIIGPLCLRLKSFISDLGNLDPI